MDKIKRERQMRVEKEQQEVVEEDDLHMRLVEKPSHHRSGLWVNDQMSKHVRLNKSYQVAGKSLSNFAHYCMGPITPLFTCFQSYSRIVEKRSLARFFFSIIASLSFLIILVFHRCPSIVLYIESNKPEAYRSPRFLWCISSRTIHPRASVS